MRILVVGTVPPPGGSAAATLGTATAALVAEGHEVEVLSPDLRSAAHRQARLDGILLALHLAYLSPRFDALVLRIERGVPCSKTSNRASRALALGALGAVLRRFEHVTLRLDSPVPIPGGLGGRASRNLWANATQIVVANEDDRDQLLRAPGVVADRVVVAAAPSAAKRAADDSWAVDLDEDVASQVLTLVRARARRDRRVSGARLALGGTAPDGEGGDGFAAEASVRSNATDAGRVLAVYAARRLRRVLRSTS